MSTLPLKLVEESPLVCAAEEGAGEWAGERWAGERWLGERWLDGLGGRWAGERWAAARRRGGAAKADLRLEAAAAHIEEDLRN